MRSLVHGLVYQSALLLLCACSGPTESAQPNNDGELPPYSCNSQPSIECATKEDLSLDAMSSLGFAANDVLPTVVGEYQIPIAWVSPCAGGTACPPLNDCSRFNEQPPVSIAGTKTMLKVRLAAAGRAMVLAPGPGQGACGQGMQISGSLTVQSEDGAIDLKRDLVIWTACGNELFVGWDGVASELGGTLGAELGDHVGAELSFRAYWNHRVSIKIYFIRLLEDAPRPITLQSEMFTGEGPCPQYLAREAVLVGAK
jgi:hypothetical protein